jgi:hypothetical protein
LLPAVLVAAVLYDPALPVLFAPTMHFVLLILLPFFSKILTTFLQVPMPSGLCTEATLDHHRSFCDLCLLCYDNHQSNATDFR